MSLPESKGSVTVKIDRGDVSCMVSSSRHARHWAQYVASGIAVVGLWQSAAANQPSSNGGASHSLDQPHKIPHNGTPPNPVAAILSDTQRIAAALESKNRYDQSTLGQHDAHEAAKGAREAAGWAGGMFWVAMLETFVTLAGVVLVFFTLRESRRSANEANRAANAMADQLAATEIADRPWLIIFGLKSYGTPDERGSERITYCVSNQGRFAAIIKTVEIGFGPSLFNKVPPLVMIGDGIFVDHPIISVDKFQWHTSYNIDRTYILGERFVDGLIFRIKICYVAPTLAGVLETAAAWRFNRSANGWVDLTDSHYTYAT